MNVLRVTNYKKRTLNIDFNIAGFLSDGSPFDRLQDNNTNSMTYVINDEEYNFTHKYDSHQRPSLLCLINKKYYWVDYCILRLHENYISDNDWELLKLYCTNNNDSVNYADCKGGNIEIETEVEHDDRSVINKRKVNTIKITDLQNHQSNINIGDNIFVMLFAMDKTYLIPLESEIYKSESYNNLLHQIKQNATYDYNIVYKSGPNDLEINISDNKNDLNDLVLNINSLNPLYLLSEDKTFAYWIITVSVPYVGFLEFDSVKYDFKMIFTPFGLLMLGKSNYQYTKLKHNCFSFIGRENDSFITFNKYQNTTNTRAESVSMLASLLTEQIYFDMITDTNEESSSALVGFKYLSFLTEYVAKDSSKSKKILNFESKESKNKTTTYMKETNLDENIVLEYTKYQDQFKLVEVE